jgi:hypothetical protein
VVKLHALATSLPREELVYPLERRLGGLYNQSGFFPVAVLPGIKLLGHPAHYDY